MSKEFKNHPCFNEDARHKYGRVHLPIAPRCNIQCNFCNRSFDCVNESRPGVTSSLLTPRQALKYLDYLLEEKPNIAVVGIAGPGDPFANPDETIETLTLVKEKYPEMLLCLASNGLNMPAYIDKLAELKVDHVSITVNALDVETAKKIYPWVRYGKHVYQADEAAVLLLKNQEESIKGLKEKGIIVKVNTVVIEGINDHQVEAIAKQMKVMGVDIMNPMSMYDNEAAFFGKEQVPSNATMVRVKAEIKKNLPLMNHCSRCRADAAGLIHENMSQKELLTIKEFAKDKISDQSTIELDAQKPYVAVATQEGLLINQHLGEASQLGIYEKKDGLLHLIETRTTPVGGGGDNRWIVLAEKFKDCAAILVSGIGQRPMELLQERGIAVHRVEGLIEDVAIKVLDKKDISQMTVCQSKCGQACSGTGNGCG